MQSASTIRFPESGNGRGRKSTASTMEKMAVVAPMPKASMSTAVMANPGDLRSWRRTKRRSKRIFSIRYTYPSEQKSIFESAAAKQTRLRIEEDTKIAQPGFQTEGVRL